MTIFDLLEAEHERALWLIRQARTGRAPEPGLRPRAPLDDLARLLQRHTEISAALLYDALERSPEARQPLKRLRERHVRLLRQLAALRTSGSRSRRDPRWRARLDRLQRALAVDARGEQALRPVARERVGDARLEKMFYEAERRKTRQSVLDSLIFPADRFGMR